MYKRQTPIYSKTLEYFSQCEHQTIKSPAIPDRPSWHLKTYHVDTSLIEAGSKHENPDLLKNLALEKITSYSNSLHVYTYASKTSDNITTAAFCVPELYIELSARTNDNITIFAAELAAIK